MIIYEGITKEIEDIKDAVARQEKVLHEILEVLKQKEEDDEEWDMLDEIKTEEVDDDV